MKSILLTTCDAVEKTITAVGVILFAFMISVVFYEVVMRYIFGSPTFWSEAAARVAMIWLVMLGLARGVRRLDNIRVDFLVDQMPPKLKLICAWLRFITVSIFALVMVISGLHLALANWTNMLTGFEISMTWIYLAVPVSGVLILLFTLELILKGERGFF